MNEEVMYMVVDDRDHWIYTIVADLDVAMAIARTSNREKHLYHLVVEECTAEYGQSWLAAWKKVFEV